jgi:putative SOS response-associated peptidase YedK
MLLGVDTSLFYLELKDHVFPSYQAPIILNGSDHLELDIAKFGLLPSWAKELSSAVILIIHYRVCSR